MYPNAKGSEELSIFATLDPVSQAAGTVATGWVSRHFILKESTKKFVRSILLALAIVATSLAHAAGGFSDFAENKLVDYLFRGQASGTPSTWYVALYTVCPTDSTAGTEVNNANAYARVSVVANALTNWAATQGGTSVSSGTTGTTSNLAIINFPTVTTASWGTIACFGLVDSGTWGAGNLWVYSTITTPPTLTVGATASFAIGTLTVTIDN